MRARSICRGFNNCAWLHFGATFKYTTFDLRSIASMRNLANISNHPLLAPHIDTLKMAAGHVDKDYPSVWEQGAHDWSEEVSAEKYLDKDTRTELAHFRTHHKYWAADAWNWTPAMDEPGSRDQPLEHLLRRPKSNFWCCF
jgi:hypothetical protein